MSLLVDPDLKALAVHQFCHGLRCQDVAMWMVTFESHDCVRDGSAIPTCAVDTDFLEGKGDICPDCLIRGRRHQLVIKEATPVE